MHKILTTLLLTLVFTLHVEAKNYAIPEAGISFDAPKGFKPMSAEHIKIKYPRGEVPNHVLTSDSTETTIVYGLRGKYIEQNQLPEMGKAYEKAYARLIAEFTPKANRIIELAGQKWLQMEFISNTIDSEVYNIFLFTGYQNQSLIFNFNATLKEFKLNEGALRKSIQSIRLTKQAK